MQGILRCAGTNSILRQSMVSGSCRPCLPQAARQARLSHLPQESLRISAMAGESHFPGEVVPGTLKSCRPLTPTRRRPCSTHWRPTLSSCKRPRSNERTFPMTWSWSRAGTCTLAFPNTKKVRHLRSSSQKHCLLPVRILWRRHLHPQLKMLPHPRRGRHHRCPVPTELNNQVPRTSPRPADWRISETRPNARLA